MNHKCSCKEFISTFNKKDNYIKKNELKEIREAFFDNTINLTRKEVSLIHNVFDFIKDYK